MVICVIIFAFLALCWLGAFCSHKLVVLVCGAIILFKAAKVFFHVAQKFAAENTPSTVLVAALVAALIAAATGAATWRLLMQGPPKH